MNVSLIFGIALVGHDFHVATMTQQMGRFQIPGFQMKDMDIVLRQITFWFIRSSKKFRIVFAILQLSPI